MLKTFLRNYWPTLCVLGVIIYATLSSDPTPDLELPLIPHLDKLIHAIMFGGFTGAMAFDYYRSAKPRRALTAGVMGVFAAIAAATGVLDEIAQATLTVERSGDVWDWVADCAGIAVAFFAAPPAIRRVVGG